MKNENKVISITSSKGGVGKTIFAINLLGVYSYLKRKVLLIDMDLSFGGSSVILNLDKGKTIYNVADDILNNRFKDSDNYVFHYDDFIDIIPSCKDPRQGNKIDSKILEQIISVYKGHYDCILIDTTHHPTQATLTALEHSDVILYMVSDNIQDLKNSASMLKILKEISKENVKVILNNSIHFEKLYFDKFDIKSILKHNIDYYLPNSLFISNINKYLMDGVIPVLNNKLSFKDDKDRNLLITIAESLVGDKSEK